MKTTTLLSLSLAVICLAVNPLHAADDHHETQAHAHDDEHDKTHGDSHEEGHEDSHGDSHGDEHGDGEHGDSTHIETDLARDAGIETTQAGSGTIARRLTVYGRLTLAPGQTASVRARFPGVVTRVNVALGDRVAKGDLLAQVESNESLKTYNMLSPIDGVVAERAISRGEIAGDEPLFTVSNLDTLWAELRVFPGQRAQVAVGQTVRLHADGVDQTGTIRHLLPAPGNAPYTLARVEVDNSAGLLTPGLLVAGEIAVETVDVPVAVATRALQSMRDQTVVFVREGETYEIRPVTLGRSDGDTTEVLSGLNPGDHYVVDNSYLIKADIEKSGASHDH